MAALHRAAWARKYPPLAGTFALRQFFAGIQVAALKLIPAAPGSTTPAVLADV